MLTGKTAAPFELIDRLLAAYDTNERINRYLIESLPPAAWRAEPPGGKGRTIASIVAHMQNVRDVDEKRGARGSSAFEAGR